MCDGQGSREGDAQVHQRKLCGGRESIDQGDHHLTVATFRSRLAISAFPDPDGRGTRVRISTLRRNDAVGKLLTLLATGEVENEATPPAAE